MVVSAHMGLPYANQCDPHTGRPYDAASYAQPVYLCAPPPAPKPQAARTYCPPQFILQAYPYDAWYGSAPMMMPPPPPVPSWPPQPPAMPRVDAWGMYRAPVPAWPPPYAVPPQMPTYAGAVHPMHVTVPPAPLAPPVCPEPEPEACDVVQSEVARPPVPLEKTAVILSHFGAEAIRDAQWRSALAAPRDAFALARVTAYGRLPLGVFVQFAQYGGASDTAEHYSDAVGGGPQ